MSGCKRRARHPSPSLTRGLKSESTAALTKAELLGWSVIARLFVGHLSLARALRVLEVLPRRRAHESDAVPFPSDRQVRLAGACLARSLARSQYFRVRGVPHRVVIGVAGGMDGFRAHAWIAPYESAPEGFVELRSIER